MAVYGLIGGVNGAACMSVLRLVARGRGPTGVAGPEDGERGQPRRSLLGLVTALTTRDFAGQPRAPSSDRERRQMRVG